MRHLRHRRHENRVYGLHRVTNRVAAPTWLRSLRHPIRPVFVAQVTKVTSVTIHDAASTVNEALSMASSSDRCVVLRGGLAVPLEALRLAWALEARGFRLDPAPNDQIWVQPGSALTAEDEAAIRRWRWHLRAILAYEAPTDGDRRQ